MQSYNPQKREVMELEADHIRESLVKMKTEIGVIRLQAKKCQRGRQALKSGHDMRKNHPSPSFQEELSLKINLCFQISKSYFTLLAASPSSYTY